MLHRLVFACALAALFGAGSSLRCRWMEHRFKQFSDTSLDLLGKMVINATNTTGNQNDAVEKVEFPYNLYTRASEESAENQVAFAIQVLEEVFALFAHDEEVNSSSSWEQSGLDKFLGVVSRTAAELQACVSTSPNYKKRQLHRHFKRLLDHTLKKQGYSAEAWEIVRKETKAHLERVQRMLSALINA